MDSLFTSSWQGAGFGVAPVWLEWAFILAVLVMVFLIISVSGGLLIAIIKAFRGEGGGSEKIEPNEVKVIQEIHSGLRRMEERIENIETIVFDRTGRNKPAGISGREER